jgi:hypothetical protein
VQFVDVVIRQAHPGPDVPHYRTLDEKTRDGERYRREEGIPWPILVDDLPGTTHQVYGGLADPTYLIDRDGRVAYYNIWTHGPSLNGAIHALLSRGGSGVVQGDGLNRWPFMGAAMTDGWRGLRRGLPQSFTDLMMAAPGSPVLPWVGYQFRPLLAPLTLRADPVPTAVKVGLAVGGAVAAVCAARWLTRRTS